MNIHVRKGSRPNERTIRLPKKWREDATAVTIKVYPHDSNPAWIEIHKHRLDVPASGDWGKNPSLNAPITPGSYPVDQEESNEDVLVVDLNEKETERS